MANKVHAIFNGLWQKENAKLLVQFVNPDVVRVSISLKASFLSSFARGNAKVLLFEDSGKAKCPWKISKRKVAGLNYSMQLQPRGGFVMVIMARK